MAGKMKACVAAFVFSMISSGVSLMLLLLGYGFPGMIMWSLGAISSALGCWWLKSILDVKIHPPKTTLLG